MKVESSNINPSGQLHCELLFVYRVGHLLLKLPIVIFCIATVAFLFQLSFLLHALRNPEVFCFADYPGDTVVIDILKATPNDEDREVATW